MKKHTPSLHVPFGTMNRVLAGIAVLLMILPAASAQDFYRRSLATPEQPLDYKEPNYNMRLGPVDFNITAGITAQYTDNVELAPSGQEESDVILTPFVNLNSVWRITELNSLRFNIGVGYSYYMDHSDLTTSSLLLTPGSELSLRFYTGDFRITVSDSFSYQENPYDFAPLSNTATFKRWENQAGIQVDWDLNAVILTAGYTHYNLWAMDDEEFSDQTRAVETVYLRPTVQLSPAVSTGVNAAVSWVNFDEDTQGDITNTLVGPFVEAQLTSSTRARLEVGWQGAEYDAGTLTPSGDYSSWYARAEIANQLTEAFSHRLSFYRGAEVGFGTSYYELLTVEYGVSWMVMKNVTLSPYAFYEDYQESGLDGEEGYRIGLGINVGFQLTQRISLVAGYSFLKNNSNESDSDYTQNNFTLTLAYTF